MPDHRRPETKKRRRQWTRRKFPTGSVDDLDDYRILKVEGIFPSITESTLSNMIETRFRRHIVSGMISREEKETGESRGYGFLEFDSHESARRFMEEFNGRTFFGRPEMTLHVSWTSYAKIYCEVNPAVESTGNCDLMSEEEEAAGGEDDRTLEEMVRKLSLSLASSKKPLYKGYFNWTVVDEIYDGNHVLRIDGLEPWFDETDLYCMIPSEFRGYVTTYRTAHEPYCFESDGYGFIAFEFHEIAERFLEIYNGKPIKGTNMRCQLSWAPFSYQEEEDSEESEESDVTEQMTVDEQKNWQTDVMDMPCDEPKAEESDVTEQTMVDETENEQYDVRKIENHEDSKSESHRNEQFEGSKRKREQFDAPESEKFEGPKRDKKSEGPKSEQSDITRFIIMATTYVVVRQLPSTLKVTEKPTPRSLTIPRVVPGQSDIDGDDKTTLLINCVDPHVLEDDIKPIFESIGQCTVVIPAGKGCGYVKYQTSDLAEKALEKLQTCLYERKICQLSWGHVERGEEKDNFQVDWKSVIESSGYRFGLSCYPLGCMRQEPKIAFKRTYFRDTVRFPPLFSCNHCSICGKIPQRPEGVLYLGNGKPYRRWNGIEEFPAFSPIFSPISCSSSDCDD